jgi:hypothetical protein
MRAWNVCQAILDVNFNHPGFLEVKAWHKSQPIDGLRLELAEVMS